MRHPLNNDYYEWEFTDSVLSPLHRAMRDQLPVRVSLSAACEPHELIGLVERVAASAAFVVIAGCEVPIPAIRAVQIASLAAPRHRCGRPVRSRRRGCA